LTATTTNPLVTDALKLVSDALDFDSVQRDFDRAMAQADEDPEDAVTAACAIFESV
jgi:hypothetical protein